MKGEFLTLFEAAKALVTYIDKESVFDKAAAGGCSGMDYHLSDALYDFIVDSRKIISEVENGLEGPSADNEMRQRYAKLFQASQALVAHIEKAPAFDKVNDLGQVGVETYQSDAFIEIIQNTNKALKEVETRL